jgi:hypothetical protein
MEPIAPQVSRAANLAGPSSSRLARHHAVHRRIDGAIAVIDGTDRAATCTAELARTPTDPS